MPELSPGLPRFPFLPRLLRWSSNRCSRRSKDPVRAACRPLPRHGRRRGRCSRLPACGQRRARRGPPQLPPRLPGAALDGQDSLPGGRDHFMNVEIAADPRFQPQALQPGGSQHQSAVLPLVQLPQPGLQIAPHGLHSIAGVELFQLDAAAQAGGADGFVRVRRIRAFRQHQHVPRVLPLGKAQQGKVLRHLHGHILEAVHRQVRPPVPQGGVQLLHKKAFAAQLVQGPVQDAVPGGLHGEEAHFRFRQGRLQMAHHRHALGHRQGAVPAAHDQRFHPRASRAAARVCSRSALLWAAERNMASNWLGAR